MIESLFNAIAADVFEQYSIWRSQSDNFNTPFDNLVPAADDKLFIQEELDNFKRRAIAAGFNHSSQTIKILNYLLHYISK